jgi:hypothetical protein
VPRTADVLTEHARESALADTSLAPDQHHLALAAQGLCLAPFEN